MLKKFGSLFAGIGGFDLGLERCGMSPAFNVEIDQPCQKILKNHWPKVPQFDDVCSFNGKEWDNGRVNLLCGGFPCQDLSIRGNRAGLTGERSGLFFEFARIIDEAKPDWIIVENVPGLLSSNEGRDMCVILGTLGDLGYMGEFRVLDSQYFGVPQRRRRVFIVGHLGTGGERSRQILIESENGSNNPSQGRKEAKASFSDEEPFVYDAKHLATSNKVTQTLRAGSSGCGSWGGVVVGDRIRAMTPIEQERLQGFPDNWTAGNSDVIRYKQLGNAVAVPVVEWIGNRIQEQS